MNDRNRDIDGDYKAAYVAEYESYKRAGRDEEARTVAGILKDRYGLNVARAGKAETPEKPAPVETRAEPSDDDDSDVSQYHVGGGWFEIEGKKYRGEDAAREALGE